MGIFTKETCVGNGYFEHHSGRQKAVIRVCEKSETMGGLPWSGRILGS
jgi:hypothetical protein